MPPADADSNDSLGIQSKDEWWRGDELLLAVRQAAVTLNNDENELLSRIRYKKQQKIEPIALSNVVWRMDL